MTIVNKRNAVLGWTVWNLGKRFAKRKAKAVVPGTVDETKRPNKPAVVTMLAAVGGALWFWRKKSAETPSEE
jgi:hypothetical protein